MVVVLLYIGLFPSLQIYHNLIDIIIIDNTVSVKLAKWVINITIHLGTA